MRRLVITLLGPPTVAWDDGTGVALPTQRALGLLAYLAMSQDRAIGRTLLADLLWPGRTEENARSALRRTLYELRHALGADAGRVLKVRRDEIALDAACVTTDVGTLRAALAAGSAQALREACSACRGEFLAGLNTGSEEFEAWSAAERQRALDLVVEAMSTLARLDLERDDFEAALDTASRLLEIDPANETGICYAMRSLAGLGRRAEALRRYEDFAARLRNEYDVAPEDRTVAVFEHVRLCAAQLPGRPLQRPTMPSIAVLPFRNLTGSAEFDFLIDGLCETMTSQLSRDRALFVIANDSAAVYRDRPVSAHEIARELGIRYLVEGSVRIDPLRIRVEAQLIDGVRNAQVWGERYDRPRSELLDIQDDIIGQIVSSLRGYNGVIQRSELRRSRRTADPDLTAYDHLMRGMAHKERFLRDDMLIARRHFDRALEIDPGLAVAYGWLAFTWFFDVYMGWVEDPAPSLAQTFTAARRSIELDPDLDFGHWALGAAHLAAGDGGRALVAFDRAVALNPNNSDAMANRAWPLMFAGRVDDAISDLERAMRLNPYYPDWYLWGLGMAEFARGDYAAAARAFERMAQPNDQSQGFLVASLYFNGRATAAQAAGALLRELAPEFAVSRFLSALNFEDRSVPDRLAEALSELGFPD